MSVQKILDWLWYRPREDEPSFILAENTAEDVRAAIRQAERERQKERRKDLCIGAEEGIRLARFVKETASGAARDVCRAKLTDFAKREEELQAMQLAYRHGFVHAEDVRVSVSIEENADLLRHLYHADRTDDLKLRFFTMKGTMEKGLLLAYIDGMVDAKLVTQSVLEPLMLLVEDEAAAAADVMAERIRRQFLPMMQAVEAADYGMVTKTLNKGGGALFIEGSASAFLLEMPGYPSRSVGKAEIEETVRGSQAAFTESMRGNISQVRGVEGGAFA